MPTLAISKDYYHRVVKCGIASRLKVCEKHTFKDKANCPDCTLRLLFRQRIEELVLNTSMIIERGTKLFNMFSAYMYAQGKLIDLDSENLYMQCFTVGTLKPKGSKFTKLKKSCRGSP